MADERIDCYGEPCKKLNFVLINSKQTHIYVHIPHPSLNTRLCSEAKKAAQVDGFFKRLYGTLNFETSIF